MGALYRRYVMERDKKAQNTEVVTDDQGTANETDEKNVAAVTDSESKIGFDSDNRDEIKKELDRLGIKYDARANTAKLKAVLLNAIN